MLASYGEEFGASDPTASMGLMFTDFYALAERELRANWRSVQALAEALREQRRLSQAAAFELIEANLPQSTLEAVRAIAEGQTSGRST